MSIEAISWVMKTHIPDGVAKLVAMVLADYADPVTGKCWPKIPTLAKQCSQSERTVQRKLRFLEELDLLHAVPSWDRAGKQEANRYVLHLPGVPRPPRGDRIAPLPLYPTPMGDTGTPIQTGDGCLPVTGRGDTVVTRRGDSAVTPIETPPSESLKEESPQPPDTGGTTSLIRDGSPEAGKPAALPPAVPPDREATPGQRRLSRALRQVLPLVLPAEAQARYRRLEAAYPAEGVQAARYHDAQDLFGSLPDAEQESAISAASAYSATCAKTGQHVKALQNWLRQGNFRNGSGANTAAGPTLDAGATARNQAGLATLQRGEWPSGCSEFVLAESVDGAAWDAYFARYSRGRPALWRDTGKGLGWNMPSRRPPASEVA